MKLSEKGRVATRREFLKYSGAAVALPCLPSAGEALTKASVAAAGPDAFHYRSAFYRVTMLPDSPGFASFDMDSLGKEKLTSNLMLPPLKSQHPYRIHAQGAAVDYEPVEKSASLPAWSFQFSERKIVIRSTKAVTMHPVTLRFTLDSFATLLGKVDEQGAIRLPALLHFPGRGTFRITGPKPAVLLYDADRVRDKFIEVSFYSRIPTRLSKIEYTLEVADIYPAAGRATIDENTLYDGYRRDFLTILQWNPRRRALANNSASDSCAFTLFEYAMMAARMPPVAEGLTACDIVRQTLNRYIGGMKGYGMVGYEDAPWIKYDSLDSFPSLVIAAAEVNSGTPDKAWIRRNYSVLRYWAEKMVEFDTDGDGLMEYPLSGNSGSWPKEYEVTPANWWDDIGFGHKDAYSNALAYNAFQQMTRLAEIAGVTSDVDRYQKRALMVKDVYYKTFYDPATGVLAGWKSSDGQLHDYYFLFINGMAVVYGLVDQQQGNEIWNKLLAKMKEVGYTRFDLGLPGNLIPIRYDDYVNHIKRWGGGQLPDGSDAFEIYENGGASACFGYYTIQALFNLGRKKEARAILDPMLKSFAERKFQGRDANGFTNDWKTWNGTPYGYEGLLVDGYLTLLAAVPK